MPTQRKRCLRYILALKLPWVHTGRFLRHRKLVSRSRVSHFRPNPIVLLRNILRKKRTMFSNAFDMDSLSDEESRRRFRFTVPEIRELVALLHIPAQVEVYKGYVVPGVLALCILLARLSSSKTTEDHRSEFFISASNISSICTTMLSFLHNRWGPLMRFNKVRVANKAEQYAEAIKGVGAHLHNCIGFIDGTNREICKPTFLQGLMYSGHKHYHSFKFQSWLTPDGLISHIYGPVPGLLDVLFAVLFHDTCF